MPAPMLFSYFFSSIFYNGPAHATKMMDRGRIAKIILRTSHPMPNPSLRAVVAALSKYMRIYNDWVSSQECTS